MTVTPSENVQDTSQDEFAGRVCRKLYVGSVQRQRCTPKYRASCVICPETSVSGQGLPGSCRFLRSSTKDDGM